MKVKQLGISILEILLVLILISTITIMAIRYFEITNRSMHVASAIKQIKFISKISYEWLQQQHQPDFSNADGGTTITIDALRQAGLLDHKIPYLNPWGGNVSISAGKTASYLKIQLANVPPSACKMLVKQLQPINHIAIENEPCGNAFNNTFTGEF